MLKSLTKLLGGSNEGALKKLRRTVSSINDMEGDFERKSDADLATMRYKFRQRLDGGEELDDILPEAFAVVREASKRVLGMRHFDVQLIGGMTLHQGKIAEMRTGEGKTLVATLPAYLNSLAGGVHVVTVNDYLARRDAQWMGQLYHFLGASVGVLQHQSAYLFDPEAETPERGMDNLRRVERREAYAADITYGTNNEFGFDYLRDNMVDSMQLRVQDKREFAIVDEVDNILIDEARTPLIISGPSQQSNEKEYKRFARFARNLSLDEDFTIDEKHRTTALTVDGISNLEGLLGIGGLYHHNNKHFVGFVENALKAQAIFERDRDYVVQDGQVIMVDESTDHSEGLHQALEAKESIEAKEEVDNVPIDEARTLLIISGSSQQLSAKEYIQFARIARNLSLNEDFTIDEKHQIADLTVNGISNLEDMLGIGGLYHHKHNHFVGFAENALKAQAIFERDRDYVVQNRQVIIVDEFTGRLMHGRRYSEGLHQAIEAKENVKVQRESVTYATITLQNYFKLYDKLSGMTGTASTEGEEFWKIYKLDVVEIPTNKPMIRHDDQDLIYPNQDAKYRAVVREIRERSRAGQPVLVGTTDIDKSELLSGLLRKAGVKHEVLNAKQHEREAHIVAQAGRPGAVTVATNMAGRGTDIILGGNPDALDLSQVEWRADHDKVLSLGGLFILGTERHEARRIDNQLRGRAGRQGDPGQTRFYVALDDDLMRRFGGDTIKKFMNWAMEEEGHIESKAVSKSIESAQVKTEAFHFDIRKHLVEYDDVANAHRDVIYKQREKVLAGADLKENVVGIIETNISEVLEQHLGNRLPSTWENSTRSLVLMELRAITDLPTEMSSPNDFWYYDHEGVVRYYDYEHIEEILISHARACYDAIENEYGADNLRTLERFIMQKVVDDNWVEHLTAIERLRQSIGLEAFGQRDPLVMYRKMAHEGFEELEKQIRRGDFYDSQLEAKSNFTLHAIRNLAQIGAVAHAQAAKTASSSRGATRRGLAPSVMTKVVSSEREAVPAGSRKVGRNARCPCGSGKKYKRCHGA